jgi:hypothetical protein
MFADYAADHVVEDLATGEVLDADPVLATADVVLGPGQQRVVLADLVVADAEVVLALGHRVDVEQHFLGAVHAALAARVDRIILAGLEARVVPVAALAVRHRTVVLLDAADDLLVQLVLQRLQRRHPRVDVGVLGVEVSQHLRILAGVVAQPVVLVAALGAMRGFHHVRLLGDVGGGAGRRRGWVVVMSRVAARKRKFDFMDAVRMDGTQRVRALSGRQPTQAGDDDRGRCHLLSWSHRKV